MKKEEHIRQGINVATRGSRQFYLRYRNRRVPFQNKLYSGYHNAIKSVFVDVLHDLENGVKKAPSTKSIKGRIIEGTKAGYKMVATAGFRYGLEDAQERYGKPLPILVEKAISNEALAMLGLRTVIVMAQRQSMRQVVTIASHLMGKLQKTFEESTQAMEGRPELSRRIQAIAEGDYPKWMANRIAQTETTRAFNYAALEGYKKSKVVSGKEWVSNLMGNPRHPPESEFDHLGANGEAVSVDGPFVRTGEELMFPGDENGSPGNVISCHCGMMPVIDLSAYK